MSFDSVVNAVIPWLIAIVGIFLLYRPLAEPLGALFRGIANAIGWTKGKISGEEEEHVQSLRYE